MATAFRKKFPLEVESYNRGNNTDLEEESSPRFPTLSTVPADPFSCQGQCLRARPRSHKTLDKTLDLPGPVRKDTHQGSNHSQESV